MITFSNRALNRLVQESLAKRKPGEEYRDDLAKYLGFDYKYLEFDCNDISGLIIEDRWKSLWRKREQLLWICKINDPEYPVREIIYNYLIGDITKEKITSIYKKLTKDK